MRALLATVLIACGGSDGDPADTSLSCDTAVTRVENQSCRLSTSGLIVDPISNCVFFHETGTASSNTCIAMEPGYVVLRDSYFHGATRGALVSLDAGPPIMCVFRACE
jgi:hypothetical protein